MANARDFDEAWDRALDAGLCRDAAADYAYDVWRGQAPAPATYPDPIDVAYADLQGWDRPPIRRVSDEWLENEYGGRCRG